MLLFKILQSTWYVGLLYLSEALPVKIDNSILYGKRETSKELLNFFLKYFTLYTGPRFHY